MTGGTWGWMVVATLLDYQEVPLRGIGLMDEIKSAKHKEGENRCSSEGDGTYKGLEV